MTGIAQLVTNDPELGTISDAALLVDEGRVVWAGPVSQLAEGAGDERIDVKGRCVLPGFVDSHTHLVFGGDRSEEFAARLAGQPYGAGGIRTTVAATRAASTPVLASRALRLADEAVRNGTTTLEIKSGYGLTVEDERRSLDAARSIDEHGMPWIDRTFLGAHVVPAEYVGRTDEYVDLVRGPMLDACAELASWCDVFCEEGAFDIDQSRAVLDAGASRGLGLRIHANQLRAGGGVQLAAELGAASADHVTHVTDDDIDALASGGVIATLLPAAEFSTRSPYAPARRMLDAGVTVALATDCNPGTSFTTSMPFVIALACREYKMTVEEAVRAATLGGARALRRDDIGHLGVGAQADLVVLDAPSSTYLAYRPGVALVDLVICRGRLHWAAGHPQ